MSIEKKIFDNIGKINVYSYTITNSTGAYVEILTYGARIRQIAVPDKNGNLSNVVLKCDSVKEYMENSTQYYGAIVGRCANRIKDSMYMHNNNLYILTKNDGNNHLHGGNTALHNMVWTCIKEKSNSITLEAVQSHGTEGYPGDIKIYAEYSFDDDNNLKLSIIAQSNKDTIFNPTNHAYFNLDTNITNIGNHLLKIYSEEYTPVDAEGIPTGEIAETPEIMNFSNYKYIGDGLKNIKYSEDLLLRGGYDHNYVIKHDNYKTTIFAELISPESGRKMELYSTAPGLQFYSGNYLDDIQTALCLEPQYFPDAVHHADDMSWAPYPFLEKGYSTCFEITYKFSTVTEEEIEQLTKDSI